jgi:PAS domain S-box-containing protein
MSRTDGRNGAVMTTENEKSGITVLIVEDSRTQAEYLQHILENEGFHVVIATNGSQALEKIKVKHPSIVLTDIIMPEMDGYELCHAIKRDENLLHIPVILVTQLFDPADLVKGLEAGANNIIIKPYEPKHVISRITSTLQSPAYSDSGDAGSTLEVSFDGKTHHIPANQLRTPVILLSTLDNALKKNAELQEAYERLAAVNEDLQQRIESQQRINEKLQSSRNSNDRVTESPSGYQEGTEPQEQARKIRGDDERFRMITEHSPFPISLIDSLGNYRFLNKKFEQLFGYTLLDIPTDKDWLSKAFRDNNESANLIRTWKQDLEATGAGIPHKIPVTSKDGTTRQISIHPITITRDEQVVIYDDLTDKDESDRLRFFLASIVSSSNDAIIGKTLDGTIQSWNRAAERYYGYLAEEVIGKSIQIIIPPELRVHLPLFLQRVANGEIIDRFDTIRVRKDGTRIEVCVTLSPIKDEEGHIIGISTIAQNNAYRKKADVGQTSEQPVIHHR